MSTLPATHFQDAVEEVVKDLEGHDDDFFRERAKMTIAWWVGRAKSIEEASADFRNGKERRQFIKEVSARYVNREGKPLMPERRIYEAVEVYRRFAKKLHGDSVPEITNAIYEELGNWSKALPSGKKETAEVEPPKCNHHCSIHP